MAGFWLFALLIGPMMVGVTIIRLRILVIAWGYRGSAQWPTVEGRVVAVDLGSVGRHVSKAGDYRRYTMRVRYRYTVDGEDYRAWQYWHEDIRQPPFPPVEEVFGGRYADGQTVVVYHHPTKPDRSLIEPNSASRREVLTTTWVTLGAMVFVVAAIKVILRAY